MVGRPGHVLEDARGNLPDPALLEQGQDLLPSQAQVVFTVGLVEELPDLVPRASALDHGQPVAAGTRVLARDDLDPVTRDELGVEGDDTVVDLRPDGTVADLGVYVVGEVYGRRGAGKANHITVGRKDEDLIGDELALQRLHEVAGVGRLLLPLHHTLEPGQAVHLAVRETVLVHPVRRDAVLRRRVHLRVPDLDLQELPFVGHDRRVQRLVHVELGHSYVVLEAARDRLPDRMYDAEGAVAVAHVVDDDPETGEVVDLVELLVAPDHFVVDGVEVLDPPVNFRLYPRLPQVPEELGRCPVDKRLPVPAPGGDEVLYLLVAPGVEGGEGEVLEFPLYGVDPQPVREGGVDLQGLRSFSQLSLALEVSEGPHVVQPVGELDDDHAHVAAHGHDHLPQRLGLRLFQVARREPLELGDPVDYLGHVVTEAFRQLLFGYAGILEHIVQQRGGDGRRVEAQLGEDVGGRERVVDERFAALAGLAPVRRVGRVVGVGDQLLRPLRAVGGHLLDKRRYGYARCRYRPGAFLCAYGFHTKIISARRFVPCQQFSTLRLMPSLVSTAAAPPSQHVR